MTKPNATLSDLVPQIVSFRVMKDRIGAIIGKGGATIKEITAKTGTSVDIEDDGLVKIFGHPGEKMDEAVRWVKVLGGQLEAGMRFEGKVKRIAEFGLFVEVVPGVDGLVHISTVPRKDQQDFMKKYKPEDLVVVNVIDFDSETGRIRLQVIG